MKIRNCRNQQQKSQTWLQLAMLFIFALSLSGQLHAGPREQAKRLHDKLIGVPATDAVLDAMATTISNDPVNGARDAALYAMDRANNPRAKNFYNVTLKNMYMPWTNEAQTVYADLNDAVATIIGIIRDEEDFRRVLGGGADPAAANGDIVYVGNTGAISASIANYQNNNNQHYIDLESNDVDLSDPALFQQTTQSSFGMAGTPGDSAGVLTTRAYGEAFYIDGTNRAVTRFTFLNFMCRDMEDMKDITRPADRIRQDVSRSPGGDSSIYMTACYGCHAGMDPLTQAFAYYNWDNDQARLAYTPGRVQRKYLINSTNFEFGYVTNNDGWSNYWRQGPNAHVFGATNTVDPAVTHGNGAKSLGHELANSPAFAQCQVEQTYQHVCAQAPVAAHASQLQTTVSNFINSGYNMKNVFAEVAAMCSGS